MLTGFQIVQQAKEQLHALTGLEPDTVSAFGQDEKGWHVTVDVVELRRIPDSSDILATYETLLDHQGNLLSYQRTRRYRRDEETANET